MPTSQSQSRSSTFCVLSNHSCRDVLISLSESRLDISIPEAIPEPQTNRQIEHHVDVSASLTTGRNDHLAPSGVTPATLRNAPRGTLRVSLETRYRKYREQGFGTPPGKLEIFSTALQAIGQSPLAEFRAPRLDPTSEFPLVLTSAKTPIYCHSQHRNLSRLRRVIPDPVVEINPATAALHDTTNGYRSLRRGEASGLAHT
jgi:hypothetical protein